MTKILPSPAMGVALWALVLSSGGGAYAAITATSATSTRPVVVCVHRQGGGLYTRRHCAKRDRQLRLSPTGAEGATGQRGVAGTQGVAGPTGLQGTPGLQGVQGPANGLAGGDLTGSFPDPAIASSAITTSKLADGSVTQSKLAMTFVTAQEPYGANSFEGATAECPKGTSIVSGGAGIVDAEGVALPQIAAIDYSGPVPLGNGWEGQAYRTLASPQVNSSYGLNVYAVCLGS